MLYLSNQKHTLIRKYEQNVNGKTYFNTQWNTLGENYITHNVTKELYERLKEGEKYVLCLDFRKNYDKDTNKIIQSGKLVEVYE